MLASTTFGIIEVRRGPNAGPPDPPTSLIMVLGYPTSIGPISDGYTVPFTVGDPANPCNHWALDAHPGTTIDMLRLVAEHLTTFGVGDGTIDCVQGYAVEEAIPPPDYSVILGVVALPTGRALGTATETLDDGTVAVFAKDGLLFKSGTAFDITVAPEWTGRLGMQWGNIDTPVSAVHVPACTPTGAQTLWFDIRGGYDALSPACVTVDIAVHVNAAITDTVQHQRVQLGIGAPCPGQKPAA